MPVSVKNIKANSKKTKAIIDSKLGNYEKHPYFVKKANEAKNLIKEVGLPKNRTKA